MGTSQIYLARFTSSQTCFSPWPCCLLWKPLGTASASRTPIEHARNTFETWSLLTALEAKWHTSFLSIYNLTVMQQCAVWRMRRAGRNMSKGPHGSSDHVLSFLLSKKKKKMTGLDVMIARASSCSNPSWFRDGSFLHLDEFFLAETNGCSSGKAVLLCRILPHSSCPTPASALGGLAPEAHGWNDGMALSWVRTHPPLRGWGWAV